MMPYFKTVMNVGVALLCVNLGLSAATAHAQGRFSPQSDEIKALASYVKVGTYHCFGQLTVDIKPRSDHLGYVNLTFKGTTHPMLPVPSNSGALRLESHAGAYFWLQLSAKNMLFSKNGSRVADDCHLKNAAPAPLMTNQLGNTLGITVPDLPVASPPPPPTAEDKKLLTD